jgi:hypothetical protein
MEMANHDHKIQDTEPQICLHGTQTEKKKTGRCFKK